MGRAGKEGLPRPRRTLLLPKPHRRDVDSDEQSQPQLGAALAFPHGTPPLRDATPRPSPTARCGAHAHPRDGDGTARLYRGSRRAPTRPPPSPALCRSPVRLLSRSSPAAFAQSSPPIAGNRARAAAPLHADADESRWVQSTGPHSPKETFTEMHRRENLPLP